MERSDICLIHKFKGSKITVIATKYDLEDKGKLVNQTKLGLAWPGTSIKASLPLVHIASWGGRHACIQFCLLCSTSTLKFLEII
jgi:hypothetical protein